MNEAEEAFSGPASRVKLDGRVTVFSTTRACGFLTADILLSKQHYTIIARQNRFGFVGCKNCGFFLDAAILYNRPHVETTCTDLT